MQMNKPMASNRANGSPDNRETSPDNREKSAPKPEPSSLADLPRRAAAVTPLLSDILERVQGVPRWGLNE
jgi:hypothetical protein